MTCQAFIDFLHEYLAGELPAGERAVFEEHIAHCPDCVTYLRSYEETVKLGKGAMAGEERSPCDVPEELVRAILAARPRSGLRGS
jgi:anti-sigma factor RsiW